MQVQYVGVGKQEDVRNEGMKHLGSFLIFKVFKKIRHGTTVTICHFFF